MNQVDILSGLHLRRLMAAVPVMLMVLNIVLPILCRIALRPLNLFINTGR